MRRLGLVAPLALAFVTALAFGCDSGGSQDPDSGSNNLCTAYATCDECIAGQVAKGNSQGAAETECSLAVTGCWTTWDKPIRCNGSEMKRDGSGESDATEE